MIFKKSPKTMSRLERSRMERRNDSRRFRQNSTIAAPQHVQNNLKNVDKNNKQVSTRVHHHHLLKKKQKIVIFLAFCIFLLVSILFLNVTLMRNISVSGASSGQEYETQIYDYINQHPTEAWSFSLNKDNLLVYLNQVGGNDVLKIKSVNMTSIASFDIQLELRKPVALWETENSKDWLVDSSGVSFQNVDLSSSVKIIDKSGVEVEKTELVIGKKTLSFVGKITGALSDKGVTVKKIVIPKSSIRTIYLYISSEKYIKVMTDRSVSMQAYQAKRSMSYLKSKNINYQYLDVRVKGKVFYK